MDVWGWIVVYALGLTVVQLLVYRYLTTDNQPFERVGTSTANVDGRTERRRSTEPRRLDASAPDAWERTTEGAGRLCPYCGAENEVEAAYTRCWNCTRHLG